MKTTLPKPSATDAGFTNDPDRIRFAVNAAGIGIWEVDLATNTVLWDSRCCEFFGIANGNVIPYEQAVQHIHPDDADGVNEKVQAAVRGENGGRYDATYRTLGPDGILRWVNFTGTAYFDAAGAITRFGGIAQEVTDRILSRQKIEENEARFRSILEESPIATALYTGSDIRIAYVNDIMLGFWGKDRSVIGKTLRQAVPELNGQPFPALLEEVFATGVAYQSPDAEAYLMVDGKLQRGLYSFTYKPLFDKDGKVWAIHHVAMDVTEQVQARQKVEESEARFRSIVEKAPVAMFVFRGEDMTVDIANEKALEMIRRTDAVIGKPLLEAVPELIGTPAYETFQEVYRTGITQHGQEALVPLEKAGVLEDRWFNFTYTPLFENGQVVGVMDVATEVTDQVVARKKIEESEAALQNAIELAELGTWSLDIATGVTYQSKRLAELFGLNGQPGTVEQGFTPLVPEDRERVEAAFAKAMGPGSDGRYEAEYRVRNLRTGRLHHIRALGQTAYDAAGKPLRISGTAQDITLQREAQLELESKVQGRTEELAAAVEELRATNEELHRSNQSLEEFAHAASHDLKEPIRKIQFFTQRLKEHLHDRLDGSESQSFNRIENATLRMGALIDDLLLYSHVSQRPHETEAIDLNVKVQRVLEDLELDIEERKATVHVGPLPVVSGYRRQLQQLFQNLVANALKYSKEGVPPEISVSADAANENGRDYHVITVADNGIGFDPQYADKIFQMFARLHGKHEYSGTGVGLSIVKKVVENHKGFIRVESEVGVGSKFRVWLPA